MDYAEAKKKVTAEKLSENYMAINLSVGYGKKIVVPYKDGVTLMAALSHAETLEEPYNGQHRIGEFERDAVNSCVLSIREYRRIKMAALLQVKPDDLKQMEAEMNNPPTQEP